MEFQIDNFVELSPQLTGKPGEPQNLKNADLHEAMSKLEPGQSFVVPLSRMSYEHIRVFTSRMRKKTGWTLSTFRRPGDDKVRINRIA